MTKAMDSTGKNTIKKVYCSFNLPFITLRYYHKHSILSINDTIPVSCQWLSRAIYHCNYNISFNLMFSDLFS